MIKNIKRKLDGSLELHIQTNERHLLMYFNINVLPNRRLAEVVYMDNSEASYGYVDDIDRHIRSRILDMSRKDQLINNIKTREDILKLTRDLQDKYDIIDAMNENGFPVNYFTDTRIKVLSDTWLDVSFDKEQMMLEIEVSKYRLSNLIKSLDEKIEFVNNQTFVIHRSKEEIEGGYIHDLKEDYTQGEYLLVTDEIGILAPTRIEGRIGVIEGEPLIYDKRILKSVSK